MFDTESFSTSTCNIFSQVIYESKVCQRKPYLSEWIAALKKGKSSNISIPERLNCDDFNSIDCVLFCLGYVLTRCDFGVSISN